MGRPIDVDISEWVIQDEMTHDDDGNVEEHAGEESESADAEEEEPDESDEDESDESESKADSEDEDKKAAKEGDEPAEEQIADKVTDETKFKIDEEEVPFSDMKKAWIDRRDQQADYTRKTQALADRRREFESEEREFEQSWTKRYQDPAELLTYLKRKCRGTLHQMAVMYGQEYADLMDISKDNPEAYRKHLEAESQKLARIDQEEKDRRFHRKEVYRVRGLLETHVEPTLEQVGLLPKRHGKSYKQFLMKEWAEAYENYISSHRDVRMSEDIIKSISKSLKDNKEIAEELRADQQRYSDKDASKKGKDAKSKPKPKVKMVNQGRPTRKEKKASVTHETFFDKFN